MREYKFNLFWNDSQKKASKRAGKKLEMSLKCGFLDCPLKIEYIDGRNLLSFFAVHLDKTAGRMYSFRHNLRKDLWKVIFQIEYKTLFD